MSKKTRRKKPRIQRRTHPGAIPGTIHISPEARQSKISLMAYDDTGVTERTEIPIEEIPSLLTKHKVTWINVTGLGNEGLLRRLGEIFSIHPLALEDVVNAHQRAKVDPYPDQLFIVARVVHWRGSLTTEQISMFLGRNYVITLHEFPDEYFEPVRQRIRHDSARIRSSGTSYLAYAMLDAVVDSYFPIVDQYADRLDQLEDTLMLDHHRHSMAEIHDVRSDLLLLRRAVRPHREALNELIRDTDDFIDDTVQVYLRDCYDHTVQLLDLLEVYREMCTDVREFSLSLVSNRMNEIMKVLTIISTIFIPLSFIASLYGMNFDRSASSWNMPELGWALGYPMALTLMALTALGMVAYFHRRGWF